MAEMKGPAHLLPQLAPAIDLIASLSGVPGVSVGVIHEDRVVFRHNYGHGDVAAKIPTTSATIYPIASLSKSFTAFLYASLVHDGLADWSSTIRETLPDFHSTSSQVTMEATPVDLISHRTGIAGGESLYWHGQPLLNDSDIIPMFGSQPSVHRFRTGWMYNNLGYAIVGLVMSALSGQTYSELFQSRIARPLGLDHTGLDFDHCQSCDVAKAYLTAEDGTAVENAKPLIPPRTAMVAAGGIRSSVNDLLVFYGAMLRQLGAAVDPDPSKYSLNGLPIITSAKSFMEGGEKSLLERTYALGWIRTQLPGTLGAMGLNPWLAQMPLINTSRLALYHQGNLPGATSAVYLFPETRSGIVVLSNGYGLSDAPDWIAQLITEALFETESETDYVALAREAADVSKSNRRRSVQEIEGMQHADTAPPAPIKAFDGMYYNTAATFVIEIFSSSDGHQIAFQGQKDDAFTLRYLHGTTYTWFTSTRQLAQRGRHIFPAPYYLIRFHMDSASKVVGLEWAHNSTDTGGEIFIKGGLRTSTRTSWTLALTLVSMGVGVIVVRNVLTTRRETRP